MTTSITDQNVGIQQELDLDRHSGATTSITSCLVGVVGNEELNEENCSINEKNSDEHRMQPIDEGTSTDILDHKSSTTKKETKPSKQLIIGVVSFPKDATKVPLT